MVVTCRIFVNGYMHVLNGSMHVLNGISMHVLDGISMQVLNGISMHLLNGTYMHVLIIFLTRVSTVSLRSHVFNYVFLLHVTC